MLDRNAALQLNRLATSTILVAFAVSSLNT